MVGTSQKFTYPQFYRPTSGLTYLALFPPEQPHHPLLFYSISIHEKIDLFILGSSEASLQTDQLSLGTNTDIILNSNLMVGRA